MSRPSADISGAAARAHVGQTVSQLEHDAGGSISAQLDGALAERGLCACARAPRQDWEPERVHVLSACEEGGTWVNF